MQIKTRLIKKLCLALSIIMLATLTSGCSLRPTASTSTPTITIWGFDDPDVWKPTFDDLAENSLKGYKMNYVKKTLDAGYENNSLNSIMSGQGPDVWAIPSDWAYRHKDKLYPAPDSIIKSLDVNNTFAPVIKQSLAFDGKLYGLAPTVNTMMLYINKSVTQQVLTDFNQSPQGSDSQVTDRVNTVLNTPPLTWTDFAEVVKLVTKRNGNEIIRGGAALGTSQNISLPEDLLYAMMLQNGTTMTSSDLQTATFNLPSSSDSTDIPGKRAIDFLSSFSNPNSPNYSWNTSMPKDIEAFASGKVAMIFGYESLANYLDQNYPQLTYGHSALPQIGGPDDKIVDYARFNALTVPALSKHPLQAWQIIQSASSKHASEFSSALKITTSKKDTSLEKPLKDRANSSSGDLQVQTAVVWNKGRYPLETDSIFTSVINNVTSGTQDTKSALDSAASKITEFLRKSAW